MFEQIKKLSGQTLIYGVGHIMARLVTFLLLPLYTNVFTTEEYGVISLAYVFMGFMGVVLHYGLDAALMKKYVQSPVEEKVSYFSVAYLSLLISSGLFALIITGGSQHISPFILGGHYSKLMVYIGWILFCDVMWSIPQLLLRAEEKPNLFISFSLTNVLATMALNLLLVLKYKMGIEGVLLSNLIVSGSMVILTAPIAIKRFSMKKISTSYWKQMMKFGFPFLPAGIFSMIMEIADRYMLKSLTNMETVGLYSAGYKLGMLMMLVVMGFNMAWQPFFIREGESKKVLFSRIATYVLVVLGFLWVILHLWVNDLVRIKIIGFTFYGEDFWTSTQIVPIIALGYFFHGTYVLQMPGMFLKEKSNYLMIIRGTGAVTNIVLNLFFIPLYGGIGAAWATCISFATMSGLIYYFNRMVFPLHYEWGRIIRIIAGMALVVGLSKILPETVVVKCLLSIAFPATLFLSGFMTPGEIKRVRNLLT